jgi:hypothetical protein
MRERTLCGALVLQSAPSENSGDFELLSELVPRTTNFQPLET